MWCLGLNYFKNLNQPMLVSNKANVVIRNPKNDRERDFIFSSYMKAIYTYTAQQEGIIGKFEDKTDGILWAPIIGGIVGYDFSNVNGRRLLKKLCEDALVIECGDLDYNFLSKLIDYTMFSINKMQKPIWFRVIKICSFTEEGKNFDHPLDFPLVSYEYLYHPGLVNAPEHKYNSQFSIFLDEYKKYLEFFLNRDVMNSYMLDRVSFFSKYRWAFTIVDYVSFLENIYFDIELLKINKNLTKTKKFKRNTIKILEQDSEYYLQEEDRIILDSLYDYRSKVVHGNLSILEIRDRMINKLKSLPKYERVNITLLAKWKESRLVDEYCNLAILYINNVITNIVDYDIR